VTFGLIGLGLLGLYHYPYADDSWQRHAMALYLRSYAWAAGSVLAQIDPVVTVSGFEIRGRFPIEIMRSCDAAEVQVLVIAAVLAFPVPWRRRLLGLGVGVGTVSVLNVLRICSLYFIGLIGPDAFDFAHHDVWPLVLFVLTGLVFLTWARWAQGTVREDGAVGS
jgi:exosortase family protein XrtM